MPPRYHQAASRNERGPSTPCRGRATAMLTAITPDSSTRCMPKRVTVRVAPLAKVERSRSCLKVRILVVREGQGMVSDIEAQDGCLANSELSGVRWLRIPLGTML